MCSRHWCLLSGFHHARGDRTLNDFVGCFKPLQCFMIFPFVFFPRVEIRPVAPGRPAVCHLFGDLAGLTERLRSGLGGEKWRKWHRFESEKQHFLSEELHGQLQNHGQNINNLGKWSWKGTWEEKHRKTDILGLLNGDFCCSDWRNYDQPFFGVLSKSKWKIDLKI